MEILKIENVNYRYAKTNKNVLNNINISFEKGKMYIIMGKSGAGKSTLLSLLSGLDTISTGKLLYKEKELSKMNLDRYRSQEIGVVFQGYNLLNNATAVDNILLSMQISNSKLNNKKQYIYDLLQKVGIDKDTANRKVLKLSGGEQQRISIARALAHDPDIIIADEPTGNLDNENEENIMKILESLAHEQGKCVIVVTHSQKVASNADVIWGITNGHLNFIKEK